jgi:hypothetical protein
MNIVGLISCLAASQRRFGRRRRALDLPFMESLLYHHDLL